MAEQLTVLIADDDNKHRDMLATLLSDWGYGVLMAADGATAVNICEGAKGSSVRPDLVLMDVRMPKMDGMEAMRKIRKARPDLPVIIMTAYSEIPDAVGAIRDGAYDYLTKPLDFCNLEKTLANAATQIAVKTKKTDGATTNKTSQMLGESPAMRELGQLIEKIAPSEATVLVSGESGTGKELAARAIHDASRHAAGPFLAVNCGALTESLLASELFGHEKGAFTGADKKNPGLFLEAGDGSIFLDEIGEMTPSMQVKLLRVLQEREVMSVGGKKPQPVRCRIIAATNRNLAEEVEKGLFRQDLYYRLNVVTVNMPPLRDRVEDIPILAMEFAGKFARVNDRPFSGITSAAMKRLVGYAWPGNVRELENVMERAIILMTGEYMDERVLPDRIAAHSARPDRDMLSSAGDISEQGGGDIPTLEEVERRVILKTLERLGNNKTEAARALGITRKTLHARLNRYRKDGNEIDE